MLKPFQNYPEAEVLVGRILISWSEIEFDLAAFLGDVLQDNNTAVRTFYRLRGPDMRLLAADAIIRPALSAKNLLTEYQTAYGALKFSKKLRNQYAHSHWSDQEGMLCFLDLETGAKTHEGNVMISFCPTDATLLEKHNQYLIYTSKWPWFLQNEYRMRAGLLPSHRAKAPKVIPQPPLDNRLRPVTGHD